VSFVDQFRFVELGWRDVIEVGLVAYVLYRVLLLLHGTRAVQMLAGVVVLVFVYAMAWVFKLTMLLWILGKIFTFAPFAAVVLFAAELRAALTQLGQTRLLVFKRMETSEVAEEISDAVERLSRSGIGAIIAVEREVGLGEYIQSGSEQQAKVSADLLTTIFTPYSPLHDGAVVVRGDAIVGAGCILPLSQTRIDDRSLGTRHRAALGLAEETDAIVIVVSEETATISVAQLGVLERPLTPAQVRDVLAGRPRRTTMEQPVVVTTA
jgi:diadenylate cyclase